MMICRGVSRSSTTRHLLLQTRPLVCIREFSTAPEKVKVATLTLPPNLTIDSRSTCSPVFGLERIKSSSAAAVLDQEDDDIDEEDNVEEGEEDVEDYDSEEDEAIMYDLSTKPEPYRAIPLPDRLYVDVYDKLDASQKVGSLYLSEKLFGHDDIRVDLLARTVQYHRNKKRGKRTAITKTISEVSGSGRKVRQQKGTGQARAGHSRPAHWRGGAKAHGPKGSIQDYGNTKLNKHTRKLALTHALSQKLKEGNLVVVNDFNVDSHKTKELAALLEKFEVGGRHGTTAYLVDHAVESETAWKGVPVNLAVAAKNLYKVKVENQLMVNVYDLLKYEKCIMSVEAVTALEARLQDKLRY